MKVLVLSLVISLAAVIAQSPRPDLLPTYCHPIMFSALQCYVNHIDGHFFNYLGPNVTNLRVLFKDRHTVLLNGTFAAAPNIRNLAVLYTQHLRISSDAFSGLLNLRHLVIIPTKNSLPKSIIFDRDWLKPIPSVHMLNLTLNQIRRFEPGFFCTLKELGYLDLSYNRIKGPGDFGVTCDNDTQQMALCRPCLPNLAILDISYNRMHTLNFSFAQDVPHLSSLLMGNMNRNLRLDFWADDVMPQGLQKLEISYNAIISFNINNLTKYTDSNLTKINLDWNGLEHITPNFFQCTKNLEILFLDGNSLTVETLMNAGVSVLTKLKNFHLSWNPIYTLQYDMFHGLTELAEFSCSRCRLKSIQEDIFLNMNKLRTLVLKVNDLEVNSRNFSHLTTLRVLDLSFNPLGNFELSDEMPSLVELYMSGTNLNQIPDFTKSRMYLYDLDLSKNDISEIVFGRITNPKDLTYLSLAFCRIRKLPSFRFSFMENLRVLNLAFNFIKIVDAHTFAGLESIEEIDLSYNYIVAFMDSPFEYTTIEVLNLASNEITYLDQHTLKQVRAQRGGLQAILQGNPWHCDCEMWWLVDINSKM